MRYPSVFCFVYKDFFVVLLVFVALLGTMTAEPVQTQVPQQQAPPSDPISEPSSSGASSSSASAANNVTPNIFALPVFILSNDPAAMNMPPPQSPPSGENGQQESRPAMAEAFFRELFATISVPFSFTVNANGPPGGPFDPFFAGGGPPKKRATQSALEKLRPVDVKSLPEEERRCHICMETFHVDGPRSPYVESVKDQDDVILVTEDALTTMQIDSLPPEEKEEAVEEKEYPLAMPCGHIFGSTCLKEWLSESPTCPLCRVEVESYVEEPESTHTINFFPFLAEHMFPAQEHQQMQADPGAPEQQSQQQEGDQQPSPQGPPLFHFIVVGPSPPAPQAQEPPASAPTTAPPAPTPSPRPQQPQSQYIQRPYNLRTSTLRHHPYARSSTPVPASTIPFPSPPSITERPDLYCAQRGVGLCSHDPTDDSLLRLECGHAFHRDCLEGSMLVEGYRVDQSERRCPRCRRWMNVLQ